uniref:Treacle protein domain-containing protein n=1 Tax=Amphilophus citrinellus TaxID=61819 RepID=A0A3Q0RJX8_AMPCI
MAAEKSVPSDLFKCVYSFLLENKFTKAAQEFLKQTKVVSSSGGVVVSPEAKKRKVPSNWAKDANGPSAKKTKSSKESSSSEDSSSEDEQADAKQSKAAPAGWLNSASDIKGPAKAAAGAAKAAAGAAKAAAGAAKAASSSSEDSSSDSEEEKAPAKAATKVGGNIRIIHS